MTKDVPILRNTLLHTFRKVYEMAKLLLFMSHSLMCVKKHKEESGCSGFRDKTAFVALSKFDEMNLLNGELTVPFSLK